MLLVNSSSHKPGDSAALYIPIPLHHVLHSMEKGSLSSFRSNAPPSVYAAWFVRVVYYTHTSHQFTHVASPPFLSPKRPCERHQELIRGRRSGVRSLSEQSGAGAFAAIWAEKVEAIQPFLWAAAGIVCDEWCAVWHGSSRNISIRYTGNWQRDSPR
jgi:hypothetical protein